jgi:hypothetical protein
MASPVDTLRLLRLFRSAPPPLVETDLERRAVYSAASEQFEQLLSASATVGFAASVVRQRLCVFIRYWLAGVCGLILAR